MRSSLRALSWLMKVDSEVRFSAVSWLTQSVRVSRNGMLNLVVGMRFFGVCENCGL